MTGLVCSGLPVFVDIIGMRNDFLFFENKLINQLNIFVCHQNSLANFVSLLLKILEF